MQCEQRLVGQPLGDRLGDVEVDHLRERPVVLSADQHVARLEVAMDAPLVMRVLDRLTDLLEQLQPLADGEVVLVGVVGDRLPLDVLPHEVGPPVHV